MQPNKQFLGGLNAADIRAYPGEAFALAMPNIEREPGEKRRRWTRKSTYYRQQQVQWPRRR